MYRLSGGTQQNVGKSHHHDIERSHPALQLHLSPVNKQKIGGVADFAHRKTVQNGNRHSGTDPQSPIQNRSRGDGSESQSIFKNNNGNGGGPPYPGSYRWNNFNENGLNASEVMQQHRVQDLRHFEVQQSVQSATGAAVGLNKYNQVEDPNHSGQKGSQSQMQHFQKKSASVQVTPAGATIARAANTTGTMPSIHKNQVAFPNLKNPGSGAVSVGPEQQMNSYHAGTANKVKINQAASGASNMKNYIQITSGERNQLLLVSNPDLMVKKGLQSFPDNQQHARGAASHGPPDLSLPSPVNSIKARENIRQTDSQVLLHKKTNSMPATSPVKRSLDTRGIAATNASAQPATTTNTLTTFK